MTMVPLLLILALSAVDVDTVSVPMSKEVKITLAPTSRGALKREGTVTRVKLDIDRIAPPSAAGPAFHTYVVWAISPEGVLDNLGELEIKGPKAEFSATTRFTKFGVLVTAEPHYMVDRPSSSVAFRTQAAETDIRRESVSVQAGAYDYSQIKAVSGAGADSSVAEARTAFAIAQASGAEQKAPAEFRNAQVAAGALEELVNRAAPIDILWPAANEAIRWSQQAAAAARGK